MTPTEHPEIAVADGAPAGIGRGSGTTLREIARNLKRFFAKRPGGQKRIGWMRHADKVKAGVVFAAPMKFADAQQHAPPPGPASIRRPFKKKARHMPDLWNEL